MVSRLCRHFLGAGLLLLAWSGGASALLCGDNLITGCASAVGCCLVRDPVFGTCRLGKLIGSPCSAGAGTCRYVLKPPVIVPPCCACFFPAPPPPPPPTPPAKCISCKLKAASKRFFCITKAQQKALKLGSVLDVSECQSKYQQTFQGCEAKAGTGGCLTEGDSTSIATMIDTDAGSLLDALQGPPTSPSGAFLN
jgi:hypothetical protein